MVAGDNNKRRIFFLVIINVVILLLLIFFLELLSVLTIKIKGWKVRPFLVASIYDGGIRQEGHTGKLSYVDPLLGYSQDPKEVRDLGLISGFAVYGNREVHSSQMIRVIALGGSTTDPMDGDNWPKALQKILALKKIDVQVLNGGVSGYSSNQELLKEIRDALPLKPDVIISLNGVNDLGFLHSISNHPMVSPYQSRISKFLAKDSPRFLPNTNLIIRKLLVEKLIPRLRRITGTNFGTKVQTTPSKQWERNIRIMHVVAREFGIEYLCFLQPTLGVGDYIPSQEEKSMLKDANKLKKGKYIEYVSRFYPQTKEICKRLSYCVDLTEVFKGKKEMYRDARHPNADGYQVIAEAISEELSVRKLLIR